MYKFLTVVVTIIILTIPISVSAEQGDVVVGEVNLSGLSWGYHVAKIELENKTDYVKYIITTSELSFMGTYVNPKDKIKTIYLLEPLQKVTLTPEINIPGNYGTATILLDVYDVVDTLDELMPWHKIFEQSYTIKFNPSDEILPYLQEKVTFPPRVDVHPFFNNEFVRILFTLLEEGKTVEEIAAMNKCDTAFVSSQIKFYADNKYLALENNLYKTTFPFISRAEAEDARKIADAVSDKLASLIATNLSSYYTVVDSLTTAKAFPRDSFDFVSGASLLYKPTPVVSALVLWFELGRNFITRAAPILIYDGTDICHAKITQYMYIVDGGDYLNGSHFFGLFYGADSYSMMFSENHLNIICKDNFQNYPNNNSGTWKYDIDDLPEYFIIDTAHARPLLNLVTQGSDEILKEAYTELKKSTLAHGHEKVFIGHRYWFWNLAATITLNKLYKNGTLEKREKDYLRFDKVKGRG